MPDYVFKLAFVGSAIDYEDCEEALEYLTGKSIIQCEHLYSSQKIPRSIFSNKHKNTESILQDDFDTIIIGNTRDALSIIMSSLEREKNIYLLDTHAISENYSKIISIYNEKNYFKKGLVFACHAPFMADSKILTLKKYIQNARFGDTKHINITASSAMLGEISPARLMPALFLANTQNVQPFEIAEVSSESYILEDGKIVISAKIIPTKGITITLFIHPNEEFSIGAYSNVASSIWQQEGGLHIEYGSSVKENYTYIEKEEVLKTRVMYNFFRYLKKLSTFIFAPIEDIYAASLLYETIRESLLNPIKIEKEIYKDSTLMEQIYRSGKTYFENRLPFAKKGVVKRISADN